VLLLIAWLIMQCDDVVEHVAVACAHCECVCGCSMCVSLARWCSDRTIEEEL